MREWKFDIATMLYILLLVVSGLFLPHHSSAQQHAQYSQYMFSGLLLNPAYAGAEEALSLTFVHRNQWVGVEGAPSTQTLSGHTLFKKKQIGLGLSLSNDKIGVHHRLKVQSHYAYHLKVGESAYFSMGVQAGFLNSKDDYHSLGANFYDPKLGAAFSHTSFGFGMGVYFRSRKLEIGLSAPELMPNYVSLTDTLTVKFTGVNHFLYLSYRIKATEDIELAPSLLFKYLHGVPLSYDINMNMVYRKVLTAGLSYRKKESAIFLLKCQINPQLQFGYAFDYSLGQVRNIANASHEIMVQYLFKFNQANVVSPR